MTGGRAAGRQVAGGEAAGRQVAGGRQQAAGGRAGDRGRGAGRRCWIIALTQQVARGQKHHSSLSDQYTFWLNPVEQTKWQMREPASAPPTH